VLNGTSGCPSATGYTCTTVTKPDGSKILYEFLTNALVQQVVYDTNGTTVLDTWNYCYQTIYANCNGTGANLTNPSYITAERTVPGGASNAQVVTDYDTYGNVTETDYYDYGPTLVCKAVITYGNWNGSSCAGKPGHAKNTLCEIDGEDSSGTVLARTRYNYNTSTGDLLNLWL